MALDHAARDLNNAQSSDHPRIAAIVTESELESIIERAVQKALNGLSSVTTNLQDRLLTPLEAARALNVTPRWLYRHANRLPFTRRLSRKALRFSQAGLMRYRDSRIKPAPATAP